MTSGAFGILVYIMDINNVIVDDMPLDHAHYTAMYRIAEEFSAALAMILMIAGKVRDER